MKLIPCSRQQLQVCFLSGMMALALLVTGNAFAAAAPLRPNILLIVSEDNGPELGCYGDRFARTPNLDRLASQGTRFERAFVPYSVCSPSRAVFLTGLYPHQNGQIGLATHHFSLYDPATPNVFTLLKEAGYRTGLIGKLHVNPERAFPVDFRRITGANFGRRDVAEYSRAASEFFRESSDKPFFLSINYPDAHLPFHRQQFGRPAEPQTGADVEPLPWVGVDSPRLREVTADYYNCLERLDQGIGLLLDELRRSGHEQNTLVIYIGDHGAQFPRGKVSVYEGGLRIPFLVRWPSHARAGLSRRELVSTVDILPTVLAAAGVSGETGKLELPGRDLQPLLAGQEVAWRQYIYGFTTGSFPFAFQLRWSIRDDRYKLLVNLVPDLENLGAKAYLEPDYIVTVVSGFTPEEQASASPVVKAALSRFAKPPEFELYDLQSDPHEWENLADDPRHAPVKRRLIDALRAFREQTSDPFLDPKNVAQFRESQLSMPDMSYRRQKDFVWPYVESFRAWRADRP
ncbi:MAG: sulfatase [Planctomycetales bacterium]|nr:sulfatase [Planctomycetales bacterium]